MKAGKEGTRTLAAARRPGKVLVQASSEKGAGW